MSTLDDQTKKTFVYNLLLLLTKDFAHKDLIRVVKRLFPNKMKPWFAKTFDGLKRFRISSSYMESLTHMYM